MPNWTTNIMVFTSDSQDSIDKLIQFIKFDNDVEGTFDFNKVITMPEAVNNESSSYTDQCINQYLSIINPDNTKNDSRYDGFRARVSKDDFAFLLMKISQSERFKPILGMTSLKFIPERDCDLEKVVRGKHLVDVFLEYGYFTWYDWCCANWGTKWNSGCYDEFKGMNYPECVKPIIESAKYHSKTRFKTAWCPAFPVYKKLAKLFPDVTIYLFFSDECFGESVGERIYHKTSVESVDYDNGSKEAFEMSSDILQSKLEDSGYKYDEEQQTYIFDETFYD